jgi:hypothetical protein
MLASGAQGPMVICARRQDQGLKEAHMNDHRLLFFFIDPNHMCLTVSKIGLGNDNIP